MLRVPARPGKARTKSRIDSTASVQPATGGWDTLSPLPNMDRDRAVVLDNWFPEPGYLRIRNGYDIQADTGSSNVETLMVYNGVSANFLFAAAGTVIYDVTSRFVATSDVTSLNNARFQYVNFSTSGGKFLFIVNGADSPRHFNGTTWATPSITGITPSNAVHVEGHKRRLWLTLINSTKAAYLPLDSIAGAATEFDFGAVFTEGGFLQAIGTWTRDGGAGPDDYLVALSSKGQAAVYAGTDPSSSSTWSLVGVYNLPTPIGRRCMLRTGTDIAIITLSGVISLEAALSKDRAASAQYSLMPNIQPSVRLAAQSYGTNFGWELISYPKGSAALLNVPLVSNGAAYQYGVNTITGAPFRYTGIAAQCWALFEDDLYFGSGNGVVYKFDMGANDFGSAVEADVQGAFWDYGAPGEIKHIKLVQPLLVTDGAVSPSIAINVDFASTAPSSPVGRTGAAGAVWDAFNWDEANWAEDASAQSSWIVAQGIGQYLSIRMRVSVSVGVNAARFDYGQFDVDVFDNTASNPVVLQLNGFNVMYERGIGI